MMAATWVSSTLGLQIQGVLVQGQTFILHFCSSTRCLKEVGVYLKGAYNRGNMVSIYMTVPTKTD